MHQRCADIFTDYFVTSLLCSLLTKEFLKLVNICQSYSQEGWLFWGPCTSALSQWLGLQYRQLSNRCRPIFDLSTDTIITWLNADDYMQQRFAATSFFFVAAGAYTFSQPFCWLLGMSNVKIFSSETQITRMCDYAQRDGHPRNIDGTLYRKRQGEKVP